MHRPGLRILRSEGKVVILCSEDEGQDRKAICCCRERRSTDVSYPSFPLPGSCCLHAPDPSLLNRAGAVASIAVLARGEVK